MTKHLSVVPVQAQPAQGRPAGIVSRSVAAVVDVVVVAVVLICTYVGWNAFRFLLNPRDFTFGGARLLLGLASAWGLSVVYLTAAWTLTGRSYGCHVMGLRVLDRRGRTLRLWTAFLRAGLYTLLPIGLLWTARGGTHTSLQDMVLGTRVVYDWQGPTSGAAARSSSGGEAPPASRTEPGATL